MSPSSNDIPWHGCWCPDCHRYKYDDGYREMIDQDKKKRWNSAIKRIRKIIKGKSNDIK
jgi:hypothetical protein